MGEDMEMEEFMAKRKKKKHKFFLFLKVFILLFLIAILVAGIAFYFKYGKKIFAMQDEAIMLVSESTENTFKASQTSVAYNSKGKKVAILKGEKDTYYLSLQDIPKYALDAMIVTEDKKFYSHNGIDAAGIVRAGLALLENNGEKTQGASTITQQLARGIFLTNEKTYERKIKEIFIAQELEKKYDKDKILEFYMNNIYFASGYYGIEAASMGYFSKSSKELTLGEITYLCAIPNNPNLYNPFRHPENTVKRKNRILDQMLEDKVITSVEYDEAYNQEITLNPKTETKRDYIQTYITYCATKAIMKKNGFEFRNSFKTDEEKNEYNEIYDEAYDSAQKELFNSGYRIYTSIDLSMQKKLQKAVNSNLASFKEKDSKTGMYKMQGAAVCIDNETGRVVAIVGGRSQKDLEGYTLNRAYQSYRQPGSSIKPLVVYTPSLERDYTPNSVIRDYKFKDGPSNSSGRYYGRVTLRFAVEQSLNTVAWQLFEELTPQVGLQYLIDMGYNRIVKSDYYLPASLGGLTYGCSPVEMASGYATLQNEGKYREPTCIIKILDAEGKEVIPNDVDEKYIYDSNAANTMVDILTGVFSKGTARGLGISNGMPCAGKTGTTNDKKDGWFCGFTPYYTTAVWVGYDQPQTVSDLYGGTYPGKTWSAFMNEIHKDLEVKQFNGYEEKKTTTYRGNDNYSAPAATKQPSKKKVRATEKPAETPVPEVTEPPVEVPVQEETPENPGDISNDPTNFTQDGGQTAPQP